MTAAPRPTMSGRVAVVTGGNSGIGYHTARGLASYGARVVLACRNVASAEQQAARLRTAFPVAAVEVRELDLASIASVRNFARSWREPVDLLVNNAGVMAPPRPQVTHDGFELQFGTNHLGHFVLTGLLLPHLLDADEPRVVTVSSLEHWRGGEDVLDGNTRHSYDARRAYGNSKLANLLFAFELQRQAQARDGILTSVAAHPGFAATGLFHDRDGLGNNRVVGMLATGFSRIFAQSAAAGAKSVLYAATTAPPGSFSGPQRVRQTRGRIGPAAASPTAQDPELARRLWKVSEELTGFHYRWP